MPVTTSTYFTKNDPFDWLYIGGKMFIMILPAILFVQVVRNPLGPLFSLVSPLDLCHPKANEYIQFFNSHSL